MRDGMRVCASASILYIYTCVRVCLDHAVYLCLQYIVYTIQYIYVVHTKVQKRD